MGEITGMSLDELGNMLGCTFTVAQEARLCNCLSGEAKERAWTEGYHAAARQMLSQAIIWLGVEEKDLALNLLGWDEVRCALRDVCEEFGDNDWPDSLHLPDVIEKHLARNLRYSVPPVLVALRELCNIIQNTSELYDWGNLQDAADKAEKALKNWE